MPEKPEYAQVRARAQSAQSRAEDLVRAILTPAEAEHWKYTGVLQITASNGEQYLINPGYSGNVRGPMGAEEYCWCAHPSGMCDPLNGGRLPDGDVWVAQILMLKTDVVRFKRTAYA